ncbi:MAG: hypothetical protein QW290_10170 [Sulfolobales archaeon]
MRGAGERRKHAPVNKFLGYLVIYMTSPDDPLAVLLSGRTKEDGHSYLSKENIVVVHHQL